MERIVDASSKVVVMANKGRELLRSVYQVPDDKIEVIAHGIPDVRVCRARCREGQGSDLMEQSIILTFGLLSPNKGIEVMIDAMPSILKRRADAVYVVLGATHPNLVRDQGEAYRDSLMSARARTWRRGSRRVPRPFVDQATLLEFISMCDVYVTPYLNEAQMTSGTLAYSFGLGKPVVSTPYWHARELLADGRGVLVPFGDATAIGSEIAELLTDDARRQAMRGAPMRSAGSMTWERTAERYLTVFESASAGALAQGHRALQHGAFRSYAALRRRRCKSAISCRCATIPACSSTPCIRCPIARTAIASTTMPARCCWPAPSTVQANSRCRKS